jgi:hypothetical protein
VSFAAITLRVASQRVFIVVVDISLSNQFGNFWIQYASVILLFGFLVDWLVY